MPRVALFASLLLCMLAAGFARSQENYTATTSGDVFVATGPAGGSDLRDLNFGGAGTLVVAPANSPKGEFQSLIRFNLSGATNQFQSAFGTNWVISSIVLRLASNYGTGGVQPNNPVFNVISGGKFAIDWISNDDWQEGSGTPNLPRADGVTYDTLPAVLAGSSRETLCTNTYSPPGNNVHVDWHLPLRPALVTDIAMGGDVTFLFRAADEQVNYLFNSINYGRGNEPMILVTAVPAFRFLTGSFTNGSFHLAGTGGPGLSYIVQAATNLDTGEWESIGSATANASGLLFFDDSSAPAFDRRYYRLAQ